MELVLSSRKKMKCMIIAYNSSRNIESLAKIGSFSYSLFIYLTIKRVTKCSFTTDINCKWKLASWMRQWLIGVLTRNCAFSFHSFAWFDHEKKIFVYVCRRFVAVPSPLALSSNPESPDHSHESSAAKAFWELSLSWSTQISFLFA